MTDKLVQGDALSELAKLPADFVQLIIADPPYFQVLLEEEWDTQWKTDDDYLQSSLAWVRAAARVLKEDGLFYIFGQLGKRQHIWLHFCSLVAKELQFA